MTEGHVLRCVDDANSTGANLPANAIFAAQDGAAQVARSPADFALQLPSSLQRRNPAAFERPDASFVASSIPHDAGASAQHGPQRPRKNTGDRTAGRSDRHSARGREGGGTISGAA